MPASSAIPPEARWSVENCLHWVLDRTFREDKSRIRCDHAPANFNAPRQFALNLPRREPSAISITRKRFKAPWTFASVSFLSFGLWKFRCADFA